MVFLCCNEPIQQQDLQLNVDFEPHREVKFYRQKDTSLAPQQPTGFVKVYYGENGRTLGTRSHENKRDVKNCNKANAILLHKIFVNLNIDWYRSKLLFHCNNYDICFGLENMLVAYADYATLLAFIPSYAERQLVLRVLK